MKKIKVYSLRKRQVNKLSMKISILTSLFLLLLSVFRIFDTWNIYTDILQNDLINKSILEKQILILSFNGTSWPVKEITDLRDENVINAWLDYKKLRNLKWNDIPENLKTTFPIKWSDYISKYKNITLQDARNNFFEHDKLEEFILRRRLLRATWTASYDSKNIWKKNTWTHAWIDIIWNVWTPVYSISNWIVLKIKKSNKWFWNFISVLYKLDNQIYISFYWHLNSIDSTLKVWKIVKIWDVLWTIWNTGNSNWSHLHLQINKLDNIDDLYNWKMKCLFQNITNLRKNTVDPIVFIEKNYISKWDNFRKEWKLDIISSDISTQKNIKSPKTYIKDIKINLIDNKIQLWNSFDLVINVQPWDWKIWLVTSNSNIIPLNSLNIENPSKREYKITFIAKKEWNTVIKLSDWQSEREYNIKVYTKDSDKIYWLWVKLENNLNLLEDSKLVIFPTNKFWEKISNTLKWIFKIYLYQNWNKTFLKEISINSNITNIYIKPNIVGKWKLIIENDKFYSKTNINVDVAKDYSYKKQYSNSMKNLILKWIVKWNHWYLYPNRKLTRRELIIILWRSILKTNYNEAKIKMQKYIKTKWKFFKDIDGSWYADPYIFDAWRKKITKWENNYSLASHYVSKAELLTIYTRIFKINLDDEYLNTWKDLKGGQLKKIADVSKKYNLYPFRKDKLFWAGEIVTRETAFEVLNRFIDFSDDNYKIKVVHTSALDTTNSDDDKLETVMWDIFDF